jgi:hypothetical protein
MLPSQTVRFPCFLVVFFFLFLLLLSCGPFLAPRIFQFKRKKGEGGRSLHTKKLTEHSSGLLYFEDCCELVWGVVVVVVLEVLVV